MKLSQQVALATTLAAAGAAAQAQNVTIYGVVDAGVERISNVGASGGSMWRLPSNTGTVPSRLGFRGSEELGGDLSAVFTLEMGLFPDTGVLGQGGRAFGRQAFVGLSSKRWGTLSIGRQYTMLFWSILDADILGPNLFGSGSLDAYLPNARADNAVAWRGRFGGLTLGATYSLGRDAVNAGPSPVGTNCGGESAADHKACREWSVLAKYDTASWGVALANDRMHGRTLGAAPDAVFGGLDSSAKTDDRLSVNGWVRLAGAKLGAGLIRRKNEGDAVKPKSDLWYLGAAYPVTPQFTVDGELLRLNYQNAADFDSTLWALRGTWQLSKRTALYAQVARIDNDANAAVSVSAGGPGVNPAPGGSQTGINAGIRHAF